MQALLFRRWFSIILWFSAGTLLTAISANTTFVTPAIAMPDLAPLSLTVPKSAVTQETVAISWVAENLGSGATVASWFDRVYFSADNTVDAQDVVAMSGSRSESVAPGESYEGSGQFRIPDLPEGTYYFILAIDALEYLNELDENNNQLVVPILIGDVSEAPRIVDGPVAQTIGSTTATIWWKTDAPCDGLVRWGANEGDLDRRIMHESFSEEHKLTLRDLDPLTTHRYEVQSATATGRSVVSQVFSFETAAPPAPSLQHLTATIKKRAIQIDAHAIGDVARVEFRMNGEKEGTLTVEFDPGERIAAGDTATLDYVALPVLFKTDSDYYFGGNGSVEYRADDLTLYREDFNPENHSAGPTHDRRSLDDVVADAFGMSDYLLVTSPINLANAIGAEDAGVAMMRMAELASLREGVLGYYHNYGMIRTGFAPGDLFVLADMFDPGDFNDQLLIGDLDADRIRAHTDTTEITLPTDNQLPIEVNLRAGDALAAGNVDPVADDGTRTHDREELLVAWGDGHGTDAGRVFIYQYELDEEDHFAVSEIPTSFGSGDSLAVG